MYHAALRRLERRNQAEAHRREERQHDGGARDTPVEREVQRERRACLQVGQRRRDWPRDHEGHARRRDCADDRQHEALGEHLANQPPARGSEREPDANLALTGGGARQQQVRDVHTCDEQHEPDDGEEHAGEDRGRRREFRREHARPVHAHHRAWRIGPRRRLELGRQRRQFRLRSNHIDSRLQAADDLDAAVDPPREPHRHPEVRDERRQRRREIPRRDADNRRLTTVHRKRSTNDLPIAAKPRAPEPIAQNDCPARPRPIVRRSERPAESRRHAERLEVVASDGKAKELFRHAGRTHADGLGAKRRERRERAVAIPEGLVVGDRSVGKPVGVDADDAAGIDDAGGRAEQQRAGKTKDGQVGADAHGQRRHGHGRKAWTLSQQPDAVSAIGQKRAHRYSRQVLTCDEAEVLTGLC